MEPAYICKVIFICCLTLKLGSGDTLLLESDGSDGAFNRPWADFKEGFTGTNVHWLGNDAIYTLTHNGFGRARFELQSRSTGQWYVADYTTFIVGDESTSYQLTVSGYSGDASDAMSVHNGMKFTTSDRDNDNSGASNNCAASLLGGWWFNDCCYACVTLSVSGGSFHWDDLPGENDLMATRVWLVSDAGPGPTGPPTDAPTGPTAAPPTSTAAPPSGGETLIQQSDGSNGAFDRPWADFKMGFTSGNILWHGLDAIHTLTQNGNCRAHFELQAASNGQWYTADYTTFIVGDETTSYQLTISGYSGDATDGMSVHNGMKFTTSDRDNDNWGANNCATSLAGGWWFNNCCYACITLSSSGGTFQWVDLPGEDDLTASRVTVIC